MGAQQYQRDLPISQVLLGSCRQTAGWLAYFDGIVHALHIPLRLYLFPLGLYVLFAAPMVLVNSLAMATIVSIIYAGIFLRSEKSSDAIYSIVYGWYAALLLGWIYPVAASP